MPAAPPCPVPVSEVMDYVGCLAVIPPRLTRVQDLMAATIQQRRYMTEMHALLLALLAACIALSLADGACQLQTYNQRIRVGGMVREIQLGECVSTSKFYARSSFVKVPGKHPDFYVAGRNCCCMVSNYKTKTVEIGMVAVQYKNIRGCKCGPCF